MAASLPASVGLGPQATAMVAARPPNSAGTRRQRTADDLLPRELWERVWAVIDEPEDGEHAAPAADLRLVGHALAATAYAPRSVLTATVAARTVRGQLKPQRQLPMPPPLPPLCLGRTRRLTVSGKLLQEEGARERLDGIFVEATHLRALSLLGGRVGSRWLVNLPFVALSHLTSFTAVDLANCNRPGRPFFFAELNSCSSLQVLTLERCGLTATPEMAGLDCRHLPSLRALGLADNRLSARTIAALHIGAARQLISLDLSNNELNCDHMAAIDWPLLSALKNLSLRGNHLGLTSLWDLSLSPDCRLQSLDLGASHLRDVQIAAWPFGPLDQLERLRLDNNHLTAFGLRSLRQFDLVHCRELDLRGNQIQLEPLAAACIANMTALERLDLGANNIGSHHVGNLDLSMLGRLHRLGLSDNSLGDEGLAALCFYGADELLALDLRRCGLTQATELHAQFARLPLLVEVDLRDNEVSATSEDLQSRWPAIRFRTASPRKVASVELYGSF